jgi:hypothetical protein
MCAPLGARSAVVRVSGARAWLGATLARRGAARHPELRTPRAGFLAAPRALRLRCRHILTCTRETRMRVKPTCKCESAYAVTRVGA